MSDEEHRLWSVTTLLDQGMGKGDALIGWAARVVAERAYDRGATLQSFRDDDDRDGGVKFLTEARWEKVEKAAIRGTALHKAAEQMALGQEPEGVADEHMPWVRQYVRFLEEHQPTFHMAEATVYNPSRRYAGTTDGIVELQGMPLIFDIKTTDKGPDARSRPPYPDVALQLAGYARAPHVAIGMGREQMSGGRRYYILEDASTLLPMPEVRGGVCLMVSPYDYELRTVAIDDEVWATFLHVIEVARWRLSISKRVIGPVISPAKKEEAIA